MVKPGAPPAQASAAELAMAMRVRDQLRQFEADAALQAEPVKFLQRQVAVKALAREANAGIKTWSPVRQCRNAAQAYADAWVPKPAMVNVKNFARADVWCGQAIDAAQASQRQ
jgi:hypothetical protein